MNDATQGLPQELQAEIDAHNAAFQRKRDAELMFARFLGRKNRADRDAARAAFEALDHAGLGQRILAAIRSNKNIAA